MISILISIKQVEEVFLKLRDRTRIKKKLNISA